MDYQFARNGVIFVAENKAGVFLLLKSPIFLWSWGKHKHHCEALHSGIPQALFKARLEGPKVFETEKMMGISDDDKWV